ncbi:MAG: RNA polymerase sigma factor [Planctomycetota bacterium]
MTELDRPEPPAPAWPATGPAAAAMREHQRGLWRFLRVLGARDDEAADLLQETFVQLLRTPFEDRGPAALHRWLRTTARNLFYAHCRAVRRSPIALDPVAVETALARYERDDDGVSYRHALARCLETLPQRQRELLEGHVGGSDLPTLAAEHDLAPEALRSLLRRCKQALRTCIDRRLHDDPR